MPRKILDFQGRWMSTKDVPRFFKSDIGIQMAIFFLLSLTLSYSRKCDWQVWWESAPGLKGSTDKVNWLSTQSMQEVDVSRWKENTTFIFDGLFLL